MHSTWCQASQKQLLTHKAWGDGLIGLVQKNWHKTISKSQDYW